MFNFLLTVDERNRASSFSCFRINLMLRINCHFKKHRLPFSVLKLNGYFINFWSPLIFLSYNLCFTPCALNILGVVHLNKNLGGKFFLFCFYQSPMLWLHWLTMKLFIVCAVKKNLNSSSKLCHYCRWIVIFNF